MNILTFMRTLLLISLLIPSFATLNAEEKTAAIVAKPGAVRVNATTQAWDFVRPWSKRPPMTRRAVGAVLTGDRVIVPAEMVANATYLEFEAPEGGKKVHASVEHVDYEANLALLKTDHPEFLKDFTPMEIVSSRLGDTLEILQFENSGRPLLTKGPLTTAELAPYQIDGTFLIYRTTVRIQNRDNGFSLPVLRDGKLTAILMSYDNQSDNANLIPAPVIEHFLKDIEDGKYDGFPRGGFGFNSLRDPQLRRYCKVPDDVTGGIYVTEVMKDSPMEKAGLQRGDVLLQLDEYPVDQDGNYADADYGKIPLGHALSVKHFIGDTIKVEILRMGERRTLEATLTRRNVQEAVSPAYIIDRAPNFIVVGGLIFQELSRQYLKDIAPEWHGQTPDRLAFYDRNQSELFRDGPKKIVFLSAVLPIPSTVGFENLNHIVVKKINDVEIQTLADIATAIEKPVNGFHKIDFDEEPTTIYLNAEDAVKSEPLIQQQYRLPILKRLE